MNSEKRSIIAGDAGVELRRELLTKPNLDLPIPAFGEEKIIRIGCAFAMMKVSPTPSGDAGLIELTAISKADAQAKAEVVIDYMNKRGLRKEEEQYADKVEEFFKPC